MTQKFLPCPFCGGEAQYYYHTPSGMMNSHHIECDDCSNGTCLHETKAEAIAAWNTRTPDPEALRSMVLQQGVNAAKAAREYSEARVRLARLYSIISENDADTPIADNGMTVWDGLQEEARTAPAMIAAHEGENQ